MAGPLFTVILAVIRPPAMLPIAIESVLAQSEQDFELCVICDGAPDETVACARQFAQNDARVKVFAFAKGAGQGELYRHQVLSAANSCYVAHISDDDIWFPDHLAELAALLGKVDFGNLPHIVVSPPSELMALLYDLGDASTRTKMLTSRWNLFGPTACGYRLSAYRKLEEGWSPAPPGIWSDLHMWRKFLAREDFSFGTRTAVTSLHFPTPPRRTLSLAERALENRNWYARVRQVETRDAIVQEVHKNVWHKAILAGELRRERRQLNEQLRKRDAIIARLRDSYYWRLRDGIRRLRRRIRRTFGQ